MAQNNFSSNSVIYSTFNVNANKSFDVFLGSPLVTGQPAQLVPTESLPLTFCLIQPSGNYNQCVELDTLWNGVASLMNVEVNIFTLHALQQSWEFVCYPHYNAFMIRNGFRIYLQLVQDSISPTTFFVQAGSGRTNEACYWELIETQIDNDTRYEYKIRNIKFDRYLMVNGGSITVTDDVNNATVWDFEISGTVPPP